MTIILSLIKIISNISFLFIIPIFLQIK